MVQNSEPKQHQLAPSTHIPKENHANNNHLTTTTNTTITDHDSPSTSTSDPLLTPPSLTGLITPASHLSDLKLQHHYMLHTSTVLASLSNHIPIWRELAPTYAFTHPFLLSGILSISSLHLALTTSPSQNPSLRDSYASLALRHHIQGVALFRPCLSNITPENLDALFLFAVLIGIFGFAYPRVCPFTDSHPTDPISELLETLSLFKGLSAIVRSDHDRLKAGPLGVVMNLAECETEMTLPPHISAFLERIKRYIDVNAADEGVKGSYDAAVEVLRKALLLTLDNQVDHRALLAFPIYLLQEVRREIMDGREVALVLLLVYAVVLHWMSGSIWLAGIGRRVVFAIAERLDSTGSGEWRDLVDWAVEEGKIDPVPWKGEKEKGAEGYRV